MNFLMRNACVLMMAVGLNACGGSGSSGSSDSTVTQTTQGGQAPAPTLAPVATPAPELIPVVENTSDIQAETEFLFKSSQPLMFSLNIDSEADYPDRVSLCRLDEEGGIDTSSCLFSGGASGFDVAKEFIIPNDVTELAVALWYFEPDLRRDIHVWDRTLGNAWAIEL